MNSTVNSIRSNNNTLILAGCFSIFENNNRPGLALVDAVSGNLSPLNPMGNNVGICVKDALIHNGNLFVTGIFNGVFANQNRRSFAAFDYPSGNLQPIHVNSYNSSMGHSLSVYKNELIIGGMFSRSTRTSGVVRIDLNTGNEIPQTIINNTVYALESFQDKIAMGGLFFIIDGQPWRNFAVFSEYFVWEGTIDSNWNISGNWTTNAIPTPNSNIMLSMEALNDLHLDQNRTIGILNFNSSDVKVDLGNYNLTANEANLSGKRTFVRTSGSGLFKQATDPGEKKIFPVGTEYYAPVVLKNRSSIPNTFSIRAIDSVYGIPNDQIQSEHVKLSWEIQAEHSMENHPADLQFKWTFTNETSNFSNGKLHHFYGGFWREIYPIGQHAGFRLQQNNYLGRGEYFALVGEEGGTLHHEKYNLDQNHVSLFPNPSNGNFAIRIYSEKNQSSKISILSTDGKLHHKDSIRLKEGENEMLFSGKPLSPGMYLVVIETAEGVITKRIIVL
ncbi:MAG: T9SS type A sorting domain-containing protein [Cryomorphaceae bacterium]|nr:T9SS type A sorting domain-containing protein [Cryomorphaceae bacterium]